jgi:adenylate cyclase class 2
MALEIEAKMKVDDHEQVRSRLELLGAQPTGTHHETNIFFDTTEHVLRNGDRGLRLRIDYDPETARREFIITYKGPRQEGEVKTREERELTVSSDANAIALLNGLGYQQQLSFQKRRHSFSFAGCKVELDEIPILGTFVEVEGPSQSAVMKVRDTLGLADQPMVQQSYIALLMAYVTEHNLAERSIEFPKHSGAH